MTTLRQLRYFGALVRHRHFGRAAEKLAISQPPLTQQIQRLEQRIGFALFARTTRRTELTDAGAALLPLARAALEQVERALTAAQAAGRGEAGKLVIATPPSVMEKRLVPTRIGEGWVVTAFDVGSTDVAWTEWLQKYGAPPESTDLLPPSELPLYVGKSRNLRSRVLAHFTGSHKGGQAARMLRETRRVDWVETAGELGALLLEAKLVKQLQPLYNKQLRASGPASVRE